MSTLPELLKISDELTSLLLDSGGELTEELETKLNDLESNLLKKFDAYAQVIEQIKTQKEFALTRLKEWEQVISRCESSIEFLTARLKTALIMQNKEAVHGMEYTVKLQENPPKVIIQDESLLPGKYLTTETTTKISKRDILNDIKAGNQVPGADIEQSSRIVIKTSQRKLT